MQTYGSFFAKAVYLRTENIFKLIKSRPTKMKVIGLSIHLICLRLITDYKGT